jgi:Txe/YoeB family toxin of toxin-antitoxin system
MVEAHLTRSLAVALYCRSHTFEKLLGVLSGAYSRRINIQHRLIYQIFDDEKVVKVIQMWTHYE